VALHHPERARAEEYDDDLDAVRVRSVTAGLAQHSTARPRRRWCDDSRSAMGLGPKSPRRNIGAVTISTGGGPFQVAGSVSRDIRPMVKGSSNWGWRPGTHLQSSDSAFHKWICASTIVRRSAWRPPCGLASPAPRRRQA
jgi:hypothetical protein